MCALPLSEKKSDVCYPCRVTLYPDGYYEELVCSSAVFHEPGWEPAGRRAAQKPPRGAEEAPEGAEAAGIGGDDTGAPVDLLRAVRRASANIRRLTHCADMRYFVTLTLDPQRIDRFDPDTVVRRLGQWCSDRVKRDGLCYVLVAEHHKDGAIHFHGFINDALEMVDSGTVRRPGHKKPCKPRSKRQRAQWLADGGQVVYNLPAWKLGFSTAIELYGDKDAAISYTCKYLTKELRTGGKIGGRWYYHGGKFAEPIRQYYENICIQDILYGPDMGHHVFTVPEAGLVYALKRGRRE